MEKYKKKINIDLFKIISIKQNSINHNVHHQFDILDCQNIYDRTNSAIFGLKNHKLVTKSIQTFLQPTLFLFHFGIALCGCDGAWATSSDIKIVLSGPIFWAIAPPTPPIGWSFKIALWICWSCCCCRNTSWSNCSDISVQEDGIWGCAVCC